MARTKFRYQAPYNRVYRVGEVVGTQPECQFSTIQAAINQAVADGHTDSTNPCTIEIYEKGSVYAENLVLNSGVNLVGVVGQNRGRIAVRGTVLYNPTAGNRTTNRLTIKNLSFEADAADTDPVFHISGTAGFQVFFYNVGFFNETENGQSVFVKDGPQPAGGAGGAQGRIFMYDSEVYLFDSVNAVNVVVMTGGRLFITAAQAGFGAEGGAVNSLFSFSGDSRFYCKQDSTDFAVFFCEGVKLFEIADQCEFQVSHSNMQVYGGTSQALFEALSGGMNVQIEYTKTYQEGAGVMFNVDNGTNVSLRHCTIQGSDANLFSGGAGGNGSLNAENCSFSSFGGTAIDYILTGASNNIELRNCSFNIGNDGSGLIQFDLDSSGVSIENCYFQFSNGYVFNAVGNNGSFRADQCRFQGEGASQFAVGAGTMTADISYCSFRSEGGAPWSGNNSYGANAVADNISVTTIAEGLRYRVNNNEITAYVGFNQGFESIQAAIDFIVNTNRFNATILLAGSTTYTENLSWPIDRNICVKGEYKGSNKYQFGGAGRSTSILGNHQIDASASGGQIRFESIFFNGFDDNDATIFELLGSNYTQITYTDCSFNKGNTSRSAHLINIQPGLTGDLFFQECGFYTYLANGFNAINQVDGSTMSIRAIDTQFDFGGPSGLRANNAVRLGNGAYCLLRGCQLGGENTQVLSVGTGNGMNVDFCSFNMNVAGGEIIYYRANVNAHFTNSYIDPNYVNGSVLARDGAQATANIELTGNVYAPGDGYEINGANFVNGVDFAVGVDEAATAVNIAAAINASVNPLIQNIIYAVANGVNVELYAWTWSTTANAYTLNLIGTAPATLTGFAGGANGSGGNFIYGSCAFGNNKIQSTITISAQNTAPIALP
jgi:hypothetical protein